MTITVSELIDTELTFRYPCHTHVRYSNSPIFKPRRIRVAKIRDLVRQPLTVEEFLQRPYNRRTRYLIIGQEYHNYRQFYLGCAQEFWAPSQLRLALYDPEGQKPLEILARPFEDSVRDRKIMIRLLEQWRGKDFGGLFLRIFADDLRLLKLKGD